MIKKTRQFHIKVVYTNGHSEDFWCDSFSIKDNYTGRNFSWDNASPRPMLLGVDDIQSVWHLNPGDGNGAVV